MKINIRQLASVQGSVILLCLLVAAIAGMTLASYLVLTQTQNVSIYRSQTWNSIMPLTEAGIEDGLQLVNKYAGKVDEITKWTNNVSADGWTTLAPGVYYVQRFVPVQSSTGGWTTNSYQVWITNTMNEPMIFAEGTVPWTFQFSSAPQTMFATVSVDANTAPSAPPNMVRSVKVKTHYDPLFSVAMAATEDIDLRGNKVQTDSFDSADPLFSLNGFYPLGILNRTKANGDVCTLSVLKDSLDIGNANIKGHVRTGPGFNTIVNGPNASVGDRLWVEGGTKGIKPGWSATDFNVYFPEVQLPDTTWLLPSALQMNKNINGTDYDYVFLTSGDWVVPGFDDSIYVGTNAFVRLKVTGNVTLSGTEVIRLAHTNAYLRIYMVGTTFSLSGQSSVDNQSAMSDRFYLFGLPSCRTINFGGNASFHGGIYAPQAAFTIGGGGSDTYDFVGASVTRNVTMNGHYNFHFDENLRRIGPARGYVPVSWEEL